MGEISGKRKKAGGARGRSSKPKVAPVTDASESTPSQGRTDGETPLIVGVGASAGGLEAFTQLLGALPVDTGMGFVLVQHLDPAHDSALVQILSRATALPVSEIVHGDRVRPNHVYVIPRDTTVIIVGGVLKLQRRDPNRQPARPIDSFFESLAQSQAARAIGVILSGTANDGTLGLEAIKAEGGFAFAQDESAKFNSMPRSAVAAGCVDLVLAPADIAKELARIAKHPLVVAGSPAAPAGPEVDPVKVEAEAEAGTGRDAASEAKSGYRKILSLLSRHSGVDFSLYKSATIQRRITRRLVLNNQNSLDDYAIFLRSNPKELDSLYADVLICVTNFFRNPETFDFLERQILPKLLQQKDGRNGDDPLRVWVLGCSTGQEAYSIAMAFVEAMEKAPHISKIQIFATDLNEDLLGKARQGLYAKSLVQDISPQRLQRFFTEEQGGYRISKVLREMVVFARQNLIADPPFSRMDLISCRNLLIYLEPALQQKAIPTFHYALKPGGYLLLGASESVGAFGNLFEVIDKKYKIFSRKSVATSQLPLLVKQNHLPPARLPSLALRPEGGDPAPAGMIPAELTAQREADRITVSQFGPPGVLVGDDLQILQFRGATGPFLEPPTGVATFNVLKMAREGLMLPLRHAINKAKKENKTARAENVRIDRNGNTLRVDVEVIPLKNLREKCLLILFEETENAGRTSGRSLAAAAAKSSSGGERRNPKQQASRLLELESDLSEVREYLQVTQEQHESANEELQSANEEVQSANEELQSVIEELETSKEELESTNEELITVNEELSHRNAELSTLNTDLGNLETSTKLGIVLLDLDLRIRRFSAQMEAQLGLLESDVGRPIVQIRNPFVVGDGVGTAFDLMGVSARVISDVCEQEHEVRDKSGQWYLLRARPYRGAKGQVQGAVLVLIDIADLKRSAQVAHESEARYRAMFESTSVGVSESDIETGRMLRVNDEFARIVGYVPTDLVGKPFIDLVHPDDLPAYREGCAHLIRGDSLFYETERRLVRKDGTPAWTHVTVNLIRDAAVRPLNTVAIVFDIGERKHTEGALRESRDKAAFLAEVVRSSRDAIITESLDGTTTSWNQSAERIFGYSLDEVLGKPFTNLVPEDLQGQEARVASRMAKGEVVESYDTVRRRKDGSDVEVSLAISPVRNKEGQVIGASTIARDITENKRMVLELQNQTIALEESDRRKDEFIAMLGHELRNPLSALVHGLDLLGRETSDRTRAQELGKMMTRQAGRIGLLVDQLLDVARVTLGKVELARDLVDLRDVVEAAAETVRPLVESRKHTLTLSLAPSRSALVIGDALRLTQVVENLLTNSAKYTDEGGQIGVTLVSENDSVLVTVSDSGVGMTADFLPHAFQAFTQEPRALDRAKGGLGIGLNIARRLVELHGGRIEASSPGLGQGSVVAITLPRALDRRSAPRVVDAPTLTPEKIRPLRILVVDDEEDAGEPFAELLAADGHVTLAVNDGPSALAAVDTFDPEVVLLDIGLPGMDGYEVAKRLRKEHEKKNILLIAVTGYQKDSARLEQAGFDHHLIKPPDMFKLAAILAARNQVLAKIPVGQESPR